LNLFSPIAQSFRDGVALYNRPTVWEIWRSFKKTCLESGIDIHPNVINYEIYAEHYVIGEEKGTLPIVLQYHLEYELNSDEYAHYEAIDCIFDVVTAMPEKASTLMADCSTQSMETMFLALESWSIFNLLKDQVFDFEITGEEH